MGTPHLFRNLPMEWNGISRLHLSWLPAGDRIQECETDLTLSQPTDEYLTVDYRWEYEGELHFGSILIAGDETTGEVSGGWTDSWHQARGVMALTGAGYESEVVKLSGTYAADEDTYWGWRIELELEDSGALQLRMFNIEPEGAEEWAVTATYISIE